MIAPQPETIGNEIIAGINALIQRGHFVDKDSLEALRIINACKKLKKSDAQIAFRCLAALDQACGDEDSMRTNWKHARALGDDIELSMNMMTGLCNLGYITECHNIFLSAAKPDHGNFSKILDLGWNILAFNALDTYAKKIESMATEVTAMEFTHIHDIATFLTERKVDDSVLAGMADIAGELLREHKLFTSNDPTSVSISEDLDCLFIEYTLQTSPAEAAEKNAEFCNRLARAYEVIPEHIYIDMVARHEH